ncbi:MAG: hypothetical protein ACYC5O_17575 [Anaerolineae bacterium]
MDIRERILAAVHGDASAPVPWTCYGGIIPTSRTERLLRERGLGLQAMPMVCHTERPHVEVETTTVQRGGTRTISVTYRTPVGEARLLQRARVGAAYGTAWTVEPLIKSLADYEVMRYYIDDAVYSPNYDGIVAYDNSIGADGIVMGAVGLSPFQTLVNPDWLGMDGVSYWMADHTAEFDDLIAALSRRYAEIYQIAEQAPVEMIHSDENVTALMVGPKLFRRYHAPFYDAVAPGLHAAGKLYVCHYDGSILPLRDEIARSPIDVVEAFTPPPMGDISVGDAKAAWPDKVIWSNFPGSIFLEDYDGVRQYTETLLADAAPGGRFVLGITEDIPADLWERGMTAMGEALTTYNENR